VKALRGGFGEKKGESPNGWETHRFCDILGRPEGKEVSPEGKSSNRDDGGSVAILECSAKMER